MTKITSPTNEQKMEAAQAFLDLQQPSLFTELEDDTNREWLNHIRETEATLAMKEIFIAMVRRDMTPMEYFEQMDEIDAGWDEILKGVESNLIDWQTFVDGIKIGMVLRAS